MKRFIQTFLIAGVLLLCNACSSKKQLEKDTIHFRYEIESISVGYGGNVIVRVSSYSTSQKNSILQAKKNAVHGLLFKGFNSTTGVSQPPMINDLESEKKNEKFFDHFFDDYGNFNKYIVSSNDINATSIKMKGASAGYKTTVEVTVAKELLRQYLEKEKIIKRLDFLF